MTAIPLRSEPTRADREYALRMALASFLAAYGFTDLRRTWARLEIEAARQQRAELAREGWIA